jgi:hypothetical protein
MGTKLMRLSGSMSSSPMMLKKLEAQRHKGSSIIIQHIGLINISFNTSTCQLVIVRINGLQDCRKLSRKNDPLFIGGSS